MLLLGVRERALQSQSGRHDLERPHGRARRRPPTDAQASAVRSGRGDVGADSGRRRPALPGPRPVEGAPAASTSRDRSYYDLVRGGCDPEARGRRPRGSASETAFRIPTPPMTPPTQMSTPVTSIATWNPCALSVSEPPEAAMPITAIAIKPAIRATALLTPDAMPASPGSASESTVVVNGATVSARPMTKPRIEGNRSVQAS